MRPFRNLEIVKYRGAPFDIGGGGMEVFEKKITHLRCKKNCKKKGVKKKKENWQIVDPQKKHERRRRKTSAVGLSPEAQRFCEAESWSYSLAKPTFGPNWDKKGLFGTSKLVWSVAQTT